MHRLASSLLLLALLSASAQATATTSPQSISTQSVSTQSASAQNASTSSAAAPVVSEANTSAPIPSSTSPSSASASAPGDLAQGTASSVSAAPAPSAPPTTVTVVDTTSGRGFPWGLLGVLGMMGLAFPRPARHSSAPAPAASDLWQLGRLPRPRRKPAAVIQPEPVTAPPSAALLATDDQADLHAGHMDKYADDYADNDDYAASHGAHPGYSHAEEQDWASEAEADWEGLDGTAPNWEGREWESGDWEETDWVHTGWHAADAAQEAQAQAAYLNPSHAQANPMPSSHTAPASSPAEVSPPQPHSALPDSEKPSERLRRQAARRGSGPDLSKPPGRH